MTSKSDFSFFENMYGNLFKVSKLEETDRTINITMRMKSKKATCPICQKESTALHSTYKRELDDTPFHNKNVRLNVTAHLFYCENQECSERMFAQDLIIADKNKIRTHWLNTFILSLACRFSSEGTSRILKEFNINISNDTIDKMIDHIKIVDNPDIEEIGVDDVAYRKGQTYCTAIYDLKTHKLIALLEGRTSVVLKEWLNAHNKVRLVTRDRASAYAAAIRETLPDCVQVADKFHLMQNLLDCLKEILKVEVPEKIYLKDGVILDKEPPKINVDSKEKKVPSNIQYDYDNTPVIDPITGEIVKFDNKINKKRMGMDKERIIQNTKKKPSS